MPDQEWKIIWHPARLSGRLNPLTQSQKPPNRRGYILAGIWGITNTRVLRIWIPFVCEWNFIGQFFLKSLYDTNEWDAKRNCPGLLSELGHLLYSDNQWNAKQSRDFLSELGRRSIFVTIFLIYFYEFFKPLYTNAPLTITEISKWANFCAGVPHFRKKAMSSVKSSNEKNF